LELMNMAIGKSIRIYDLAREVKQDTKRVMEDLRREGADVSVASNSVSYDIAEKVRNKYFPKTEAAPKRAIKVIKAAKIVDEAPAEVEVEAAPVQAEAPPVAEPVAREVAMAPPEADKTPAVSKVKKLTVKAVAPPAEEPVPEPMPGIGKKRVYGPAGSRGPEVHRRRRRRQIRFTTVTSIP